MVIESAVFSRPTWMYMEDGVIEVNLPEWSGRMNKAYALAELANLKAFIAKVESVLNGPTVRTPRDFTPSERSEVIAEAIAEDEADDLLEEWDDDDDESSDDYDPDYDFEGWDSADWDDHAWGIEPQPVDRAEPPLWSDVLTVDYSPVVICKMYGIHLRPLLDNGIKDIKGDWIHWARSNVSTGRAWAKIRRRNVIDLIGARPYIPRYRLARDIRTFEGEVYRVIDPRDLNTNDIPF